MNILHLANVLGKNRGGGIHEVAFNLWSYQNSIGISSTLWFPGKMEEIEEIQDERINSSKILALDTHFHPDYGILRNFNKLFEEIKSFDIIHQHGLWLPNSILTYRAKRKSQKKVILHPHGFLEPYSLKRSRFKKLLPYWLFENKNLEKCDCLIASSNQEFNNLREFFPRKNIALIPNGLSKSFFEMSASKDYFNPENFRRRKNLLFLSRIHPTKGIERLLDVFSEIVYEEGKEWNLVISGVGENDYIKKLINKTKKLNLTSRVFFEGPIFEKTKVDILSSADLLVLPTFSENFGVVVIEALSKGLPVLTTHAAPWKLLEEYNCGFWVPNSSEGIKEGLIKAMSLEEHKLKRMGENGRKLVADHFIWDDIVKQTIELYEWLLHGGHRPSFVDPGDPNKSNKPIF